MRTFVLITALLAACSSRPALAAQQLAVKRETATVQRDVRAMSDALFKGDSDTLVRYTFPSIVEAWGGAAAFAKVYAGVAATQTKLGIQRESITFPTPPEFIEGKNGRWFVLVSSRTVVFGNGGRGAANGFHLGVKEPGAKQWKYIPGQFINPERLPSLLPDFPARHPLPPQSNEKLPPRDSSSKPETR